jgi:putative solute:sodium symporter small subunit
VILRGWRWFKPAPAPQDLLQREAPIHKEAIGMQLTQRHVEYWKRNLNLTIVLMAIWFIATFVMAWFARELATINLFGWPLSFYMAAQGSLIIYVVIIWFYGRRMRKLDDEYGVAEGDD